MQPMSNAGSLFLIIFKLVARREKWLFNQKKFMEFCCWNKRHNIRFFLFLFLAIQPLIVFSSPHVGIGSFFLATFFFLVIEAIVRQTLNDKLEQYGMSSASLPYYVPLPLLAASVFYCWTSDQSLRLKSICFCTEHLDQLVPLSSCRKFLIAVGKMPPDPHFIVIRLNLYN